jgi:hypothetical protein
VTLKLLMPPCRPTWISPRLVATRDQAAFDARRWAQPLGSGTDLGCKAGNSVHRRLVAWREVVHLRPHTMVVVKAWHL